MILIGEYEYKKVNIQIVLMLTWIAAIGAAGTVHGI